MLLEMVPEPGRSRSESTELKLLARLDAACVWAFHETRTTQCRLKPYKYIKHENINLLLRPTVHTPSPDLKNVKPAYVNYAKP